MRILITGTTGDSMPPPYGGIPKVSLLYAREWIKSGHEVAITFVYCPPAADDLGAKAKYFFEYGSRPNKISKSLFLLKYAFINPKLYINLFRSYFRILPRFQLETILYSAYGVYLDQVIAQYEPDIILAEAALVKTFMVVEIASKRKIPIVVDSYAEIKDLQMGANKHLTEEGREKYWRTFLSKTDLVLGISNCTVGALKYLPEEKVKKFYDACDFSKYNGLEAEDRMVLRKHFKIPAETLLIGAVGAFEKRKGHDKLIEAVGILNKKGYNVSVAICGGSGDPSSWKELANKNGIAGRVFLFSRLPEAELIRFYRMLDLYSNLSNSERSCGLDLALLEGMASGLPIVVYNNGGLKEAIYEGRNGYLVRTDDTNGLVEVIEKFIGLSESDRKRMGEESAKYSSRFDIKETAKIKLGWLKEIIINNK